MEGGINDSIFIQWRSWVVSDVGIFANTIFRRWTTAWATSVHALLSRVTSIHVLSSRMLVSICGFLSNRPPGLHLKQVFPGISCMHFLFPRFASVSEHIVASLNSLPTYSRWLAQVFKQERKFMYNLVLRRVHIYHPGTFSRFRTA